MTPLQMSPEPGTRLVRHAGDFLSITLEGLPPGHTARLRTNLGRASRSRAEIIHAHFERLPLAGASWRDIPMEPTGEGRWTLTVPLTEVGFFRAKAFAMNPSGRQVWPEGPDLTVSVHPSWTRTANTLYCAFPRMLGPNKARRSTQAPELESRLKDLDAQGYAVIPPSGTLRDLIRELPHIVDTLGCRIVHLLPINPTPTTFARFGRFGSPYALQHLTAIDPALVEFDRRTTGLEQFAELVHAIHARGARLMLDVVINHTGWGSALWEEHPEWFVRKASGEFECPGAWDVVWEDLVELDQRHVPLWEHIAEAFLTWCRRGVDAFRCDAGYKIPTRVWQYITARVREEFPETVFLLEGLGGSWEATAELLGEGGMQWAYSELFQNHGGDRVGGYLDHAFSTSFRNGTLIHYSETHDNSRLAAQPLPDAPTPPAGTPLSPNLGWSLLRNRLCALTSVNGGFGFTSGVEWAATEQVNVHSARGLAWGSEPNLVAELATLNRLLADNPCFFDGARLTRLSPDGSPVYALRRDSAQGLDSVLVLCNTDPARPQSVRLPPQVWAEFSGPCLDLLQPDREVRGQLEETSKMGRLEVTLHASAAHCLALTRQPRGLHGEAYRLARARADWALAAAGRVRGLDALKAEPTWDLWLDIANGVDTDPEGMLARTLGVEGPGYRPVVRWEPRDRNRVTLVPDNHWLLVQDSVPFRVRLKGGGSAPLETATSVRVRGGFVACFAPRQTESTRNATVTLERYDGPGKTLRAPIRFLPASPQYPRLSAPHDPDAVVLLTNGRGAMSRIRADLGAVRSKYDCVLAANLHPEVPVDRHVFVKRFRAWVNADGFITPLNLETMLELESGPPAHWRFVVNAGDGRSVEIHLLADLLDRENTVVLRFLRPEHPRRDSRLGRPLEPGIPVTVILRPDIEDRSFHQETQCNDGSRHHFGTHCRATITPDPRNPSSTAPLNGFEFTPAPDRQLRIWSGQGRFHPEPEWSLGIPHPIEASRGQTGAGDAYSPGWFEMPLDFGGSVDVVITAEPSLPEPDRIASFVAARVEAIRAGLDRSGLDPLDTFGRQLVQALPAYVVRRNATRSVIAGYPWFLDWGRDSLIAARGLLAAGMVREIRELLLTFGRFESQGTLPNSIHGEDASNRDTSDAPLWFGIVCEELHAAEDPSVPGSVPLYETPVDATGRTVAQVLRSIACGYLSGTPNGIRVDAASGLVWSPSHFTWMDTNHPAGTPREGYPVEIQALWIRLLRHLARLKAEPWEGRGESWSDLARRAEDNFHRYFWLEDCGWYADVLLAPAGQPARTAPQSNALRSNTLLVITLGIDQHPAAARRARRTVDAVARLLVVPGALRSLAPLPVIPPLPIHAHHGGLLNDPDHPYWPRYEGDEDTRRKPAYHNGTAWTWTFPGFCEALICANPGDPRARAAARSCLASVDTLLAGNCEGHLPEITDGDTPHTHRGCDAQAWGMTEVLRVWRQIAE
ncbi:MAG: amylo-alpha-1,6-glucosidase [Limisphaerales bacterium]